MIGPEATGILAARMENFLEDVEFREEDGDQVSAFFGREDFIPANAAQFMADYARLGLKEYWKLLEAAKITESNLTQLSEKFRDKAGLNEPHP